MDFGYKISKPRSINLDTNDMTLANKVLAVFPELETCIACGNCAATCTAGNLVEYSFRKTHTLVRRGEIKDVREMLDKCMLCGKCRLICPRGINTRGVIQYLKKQLYQAK